MASISLVLALATGFPAASPAQATPAIRWDLDPSGMTVGVSVVGLSSDAIQAIGDPLRGADRALSSLSVTIQGPKNAGLPSILGSYRVEGNALRFTPRYPFDRGRTYLATFRPDQLPGGSGPRLEAIRLVPKPSRPSTLVTKVTPSSDRIPENLLKFYLHFSSPMSRGHVYDRVSLIKEDGKAVDLPFLRLGEELWDPTGTRLTLLIDPGRIKRGLRPREESGPVLEAGHRYTLVIDPAWPDAEGNPLGRSYAKPFVAEAAAATQPDPARWKLESPAASTRAPLVLTFPGPLDGALIESTLTLIDARGTEVDGRVEIPTGEAGWTFIPDAPWVEGDYQLVVDADLEDLAGNSVLRPFEVDIQRDTPSRPEAKVVRLPIAIRPKGRRGGSSLDADRQGKK